MLIKLNVESEKRLEVEVCMCIAGMLSEDFNVYR
jgi:hypothetical protein